MNRFDNRFNPNHMISNIQSVYYSGYKFYLKYRSGSALFSTAVCERLETIISIYKRLEVFKIKWVV